MARIRQHAPLHCFTHVEKILRPVVLDVVGILQTLAHALLGAHELEVRRVVGRPVNRHLDQRAAGAELRGTLELDHVALPRVIRCVVVAHHAAVVHEAVLEHELDGVRAEVPRRRAISPRVLPRDFAYRLVAANELRFLFLTRETRRWPVSPAVMRDLVPRVGHGFHRVGIGFDRVARHIPRAGNVVLAQKCKQSRRTDARAELPARDPARCRLPTRDETRDGVEIERETDDVFGHLMRGGPVRASEHVHRNGR